MPLGWASARKAGVERAFLCVESAGFDGVALPGTSKNCGLPVWANTHGMPKLYRPRSASKINQPRL